MKFILRKINGDWEQLIYEDSEKVICENHKLSAEEVLFALGFKFECEEIWTDDEDMKNV